MSNFKPTEDQQAIVDFIATRPNDSVKADARAGAAKTSTIVLAAQKIPPQYSTCAIAFNKKIAEELAARLPRHFVCLTLNSAGHRAWGSRLGKKLIVEMDKMMKLAKTTIPYDEDYPETMTEALILARRAKNSGLVPFGVVPPVKGLWPDTDASWEQFAAEVGMFELSPDAIQFARQLLRESIALAWKGIIDYDDQIYMSVLFGGTYPKYHTVIIDEAQDLSPLNHLQIKKMVGTRAIVVGDPYQAIYGFRGADSNSIENLCSMLEKPFTTLKLSKSFRVPKKISARQTHHVPDFGSMDWLPDGEVLFWPPPQALEDGGDGKPANSWSLTAIPYHGAVLCRNNAPLMSLAFAMIKQRRAVKILGRDIGASIANLLIKITGKTSVPIDDCWQKLSDWREREVAKAGDSETKLDIIQDRYEAIYVLLEAGGCSDNLTSAAFIRELFTDKEEVGTTTFSSIHRSKGLEWDWVMMLDPFRIPSEQAIRAARKGNPAPLLQEHNLGYVGETRSKGTLVFANLEHCLEVGE